MTIAPARFPFALAEWTNTLQRSLLRDMIAVSARPGILSLAGGLPAPELFPTRGYAAALAQVLANDTRALQYSPPFEPLKAHIVELMALRGVTVQAEQIFLTTGAQQGLDILARLLLNRGGQVIIEETVYTGATQVLTPHQPHLLTVGTDLTDGMDVAAVAQHLAEGARPAFIYIIPEAHNPLGVSMSQSKRQQLMEVARYYNVPIIEDDPYGFLTFDEQPLPPLYTLDADNVFYLGSFSKILAPALRLGWMIAPLDLLPKLTVIKEAADLESSGLTQKAVSAYLDTGALSAHLAMLRTAYRARRNALLDALARYFPTSARWSIPTGGMFVWVELGADIDTMALLPRAVEEQQVAFIPGRAFAVNTHPRANSALRLNFSNASETVISEAVGRLSKLLD